MVAQLKELANLVGNQRDPRVRSAAERLSGASGQRSRTSAFADNDLRDATDLVAKAADTLAEMGRRNQELEAAASRAVLHYKTEAESANKRSAELCERIEALEAEFHAQVSDFQHRIDDLQSRLSTTMTALEEKTQDADFANEWLVYLSTEIRQRLGDAPKKLAEMSRESRGRRFEFSLD